MCGRFANSETIPAIAARWSAATTPEAETWEPNADIRPTQRVPVLLEGPTERPRRLGLMTWGWTRDFVSSGKLINARSEDITTKRTFAEAVQRRRCLVPATAWFEWQRKTAEDRRGVKHQLRPEGLETWAFAALWEKDGDGGAVVLLTTAAHPTIATIHDRMPVVIASDQGSLWMAGTTDAALGLVAAVTAVGEPS